VTASTVNMAEKESTVSDSFVFEAVKFGRALADIRTRVNQRQIEAVEASSQKKLARDLRRRPPRSRPRRSVSPMMPTPCKPTRPKVCAKLWPNRARTSSSQTPWFRDWSTGSRSAGALFGPRTPRQRVHSRKDRMRGDCDRQRSMFVFCSPLGVSAAFWAPPAQGRDVGR
jgi:hypothetical protein